jgi:hypothetical protein
MDEVTSILGILPVAIRASEILGVDSQLRDQWRHLLENMAELPTVRDSETGRMRFYSGRPFYTYDLFTLETTDQELKKLADATFFPGEVDFDKTIHILSRSCISAATLGRSDLIKMMLPNYIRCLSPQTDFCYYEQTGRTGALANRMTLREGVNAIGAQRLGLVCDSLHLALCQSVPAGPAQDTVIRVFEAWPKDWDAKFTLLCRGGFLVTSSMQKGEIEFIEIYSQLGEQCRVRNPWSGQEVTIYRNAKKWKKVDGSLLKFDTAKNDSFVLVVNDKSLDQLKKSVLADNKQ